MSKKNKEEKKNICDFCGKKLDYEPFVCKFCGYKFCSEHRIPEKHNCSGLKKYKEEFEKPTEYFYQNWKPYRAHKDTVVLVIVIAAIIFAILLVLSKT